MMASDNGKAKGLAVALGVVVLGGVAYTVLQAKHDARRADLIDGGYITESHVKVRVECAVRNLCRELPDGGSARRYATIETAAWVRFSDAGEPEILLPATRRDAGRSCLEPVGEDACRIQSSPTECDDPELCDDANEGRTRPAPDRCFCEATGQVCRWRGNPDGGWVRFGRGIGGSNVHPGPVQGPNGNAGCVRAPCTQVAGDETVNPPECQ